MEENQAFPGFDLHFAFSPYSLGDLVKVILGTPGNPGKLPDFGFFFSPLFLTYHKKYTIQ